MAQELTQKKNCNGCRASERYSECSLGYKCEDYKPKEPCPKPLTIQKLIEAKRKETSINQ